MLEDLLPPPKKSWRQVIQSLPADQKDYLTERLSDNDMKALAGDWFLDARREQIEPPGDWWLIWLVMAGRGFGKNWAGSNWLVDKHRLGGAKNSGIVAATTNDLRRYCLEGPSGILSTAPNDFRPVYQPSKTRLLWPNGSVTLTFSSEEPDRLRGPNLDYAWCDEVAAWRNPEQVLEMLFLTLRLGDNPKAMMTTTPRPIAAIRSLLAREGDDVVVTRGATTDNKTNLAPSFWQQIVKQYEGTRLERQEIYGELLEDFEGALWNHSIIEASKNRICPGLTKTVVGLDPPTTSKGEAGIVVAGLCDQKRGHTLADLSLSGSPETWGRAAVHAYYKYDATAIVAEVNQGGEMVNSVIKNIDRNVRIITVRASVGKVARAEPVALLYEQGRIDTHCDSSKLEDEMCAMVPGELKESPNRVDALVWAYWELIVKYNRFRGGTFGRRNPNNTHKVKTPQSPIKKLRHLLG